MAVPISSRYKELIEKRETSIEDNVKRISRSAISLQKEQRRSLTWFWKMIKSTPKDWEKGDFDIRKSIFIGGMFFFMYDPKYKMILPIYDVFPLVIPIEIYMEPEPSFLGLNLHYVNNRLRIKILDTLRTYIRKLKTKVYMNVSYGLLKYLAEFDIVKPTIHRYLISHMRSPLVRVHHEVWEYAALLPAAQWRGRRKKRGKR